MDVNPTPAPAENPREAWQTPAAEVEQTEEPSTGETIAALLDLVADAIKRRGYDAVYDLIDHWLLDTEDE